MSVVDVERVQGAVHYVVVRMTGVVLVRGRFVVKSSQGVCGLFRVVATPHHIHHVVYHAVYASYTYPAHRQILPRVFIHHVVV